MRTGVWLVGARGSVAVTSIVGALALRAGLAPPVGCVTELPALRSPALPGLGRPGLRRSRRRRDAAGEEGRGARRRRCAAGAGWSRRSPPSWPRSSAELRPAAAGAAPGGDGATASPPTSTRFRDRHDLDRVVVVNVSSTEPAPPRRIPAHADLDALRAALREPGRRAAAERALRVRRLHRRLPPIVDFTPSTGARLPALDAARPRGPACRTPATTARPARRWSSRCWRRCSRMRNLRVRTLVGRQPARRRRRRQPGRPGAERGQGRQQAAGARGDARLRSRRATPASTTCDDIGDFKTAWDLITFSGFLGTPMRMEFTWHGCDSALAAPLVLDLARLTAAAHARRAGRPADRAGVLLQGPARRRAARAGRAVGRCCARSSAELADAMTARLA